MGSLREYGCANESWRKSHIFTIGKSMSELEALNADSFVGIVDAVATNLEQVANFWQDVAFEGDISKLAIDQLTLALRSTLVALVIEHKSADRKCVGFLDLEKCQYLWAQFANESISDSPKWLRKEFEAKLSLTGVDRILFGNDTLQLCALDVIVCEVFGEANYRWMIGFQSEDSNESLSSDYSAIGNRRLVEKTFARISEIIHNATRRPTSNTPDLHYSSENLTSRFLGTSIDVAMESTLGIFSKPGSLIEQSWWYDLFVVNTAKHRTDKILLRRLVTPKQLAYAQSVLGKDDADARLADISRFCWTERTSIVGRVAIHGCSILVNQLGDRIKMLKESMTEEEIALRQRNRRTFLKLRPPTDSVLVCPLYSNNCIVGVLQINHLEAGGAEGEAPRNERTLAAFLLRAILKISGLHHSMTLSRELDPIVKNMTIEMADSMTSVLMRSLRHNERHFLCRVRTILESRCGNDRHTFAALSHIDDRLDFMDDIEKSRSLIVASENYKATYLHKCTYTKEDLTTQLDEIVKWVDSGFAKEAKVDCILNIGDQEQFTIRWPKKVLRRVLFNLISNSISHATESASPNVSLGFELVNENLQIVIEDNSGGNLNEINTTSLSSVNGSPEEMLVRLLKTSKSHGIGWLLTSKYVYAAGGSWKVERVLNPNGPFGARVTVLLPMDRKD